MEGLEILSLWLLHSWAGRCLRIHGSGDLHAELEGLGVELVRVDTFFANISSFTCAEGDGVYPFWHPGCHGPDCDFTVILEIAGSISSTGDTPRKCPQEPTADRGTPVAPLANCGMGGVLGGHQCTLESKFDTFPWRTALSVDPLCEEGTIAGTKEELLRDHNAPL